MIPRFLPSYALLFHFGKWRKYSRKSHKNSIPNKLNYSEWQKKLKKASLARSILQKYNTYNAHTVSTHPKSDTKKTLLRSSFVQLASCLYFCTSYSFACNLHLFSLVLVDGIVSSILIYISLPKEGRHSSSSYVKACMQEKVARLLQQWPHRDSSKSP
jgi:hypothetical protein